MSPASAQTLKNLWSAWKRLARQIGNFQARVILTVLYVVAVLPFGLMVRLFADPLQIRNRPTKWTERPAEVYDLSWVHKQ
jgi:hypothetical protein